MSLYPCASLSILKSKFNFFGNLPENILLMDENIGGISPNNETLIFMCGRDQICGAAGWRAIQSIDEGRETGHELESGGEDEVGGRSRGGDRMTMADKSEEKNSKSLHSSVTRKAAKERKIHTV